MLHHRIAADSLKVIDLFYLPILRFSVGLSPSFVMLRAVASGLVFGRDPNPDAGFESVFFIWKCHHFIYDNKAIICEYAWCG